MPLDENVNEADFIGGYLGEPLDVEPEWVYPLLKGADLVRGPAPRPTRSVIVTQRRVGQDREAGERLRPFGRGHAHERVGLRAAAG